MSANQMCGANIAGGRVLVFNMTHESRMSTGPRAALPGVDFSPLLFGDILDKQATRR